MKNVIRFPVERTRLPRDCTLDEFMVRKAELIPWPENSEESVLTEEMLEEAMESLYRYDRKIFMDTEFGVLKYFKHPIFD